MRNVGSKVDGAGLCVFTSMQHTFRYQGYDYEDFRKWMESKPGGGYPEKVDRMIRQYCGEKGVPEPRYVHIVGVSDWDEIVEVLKAALQNGYLPCITWGSDCTVYGNRPIAHMVNLIYLDDEWGAIIDNNRPDKILWVKRPDWDKFTRRGGFWAMIYLDNACPVAMREPKRHD